MYQVNNPHKPKPIEGELEVNDEGGSYTTRSIFEWIPPNVAKVGNSLNQFPWRPTQCREGFFSVHRCIS